MNEIYNQFKDDMEFFFVYVREAHPTDGWQVDTNIEEGIIPAAPEHRGAGISRR